MRWYHRFDVWWFPVCVIALALACLDVYPSQVCCAQIGFGLGLLAGEFAIGRPAGREAERKHQEWLNKIRKWRHG